MRTDLFRKDQEAIGISWKSRVKFVAKARMEIPPGAQEKGRQHATASALLDGSLKPGLSAHVPHALVPRATFQDAMVALTYTTDPIVSLHVAFLFY